jgi:Flp pilus assembly protein TadB
VANVFTLYSNEHYFRLRNRALPQDSHSSRGPTRDLCTVIVVVVAVVVVVVLVVLVVVVVLLVVVVLVVVIP